MYWNNLTSLRAPLAGWRQRPWLAPRPAISEPRDQSGVPYAVVSLDGNYAVFTSTAENLVPNDSNLFADVFVATRRVTAPSSTVLRINAGGPALAATDGGPNWLADTDQNPSPYVNFIAGDAANLTVSWSTPNQDVSVPASTPPGVFATERYDNPGGPNMHWSFPLDADQSVEVRLYFASGFDGASEPGQRLFDVMIDNALVLDNYDIVSDVGHKVGVMKAFAITTDSDGLDIHFFHLDPPVQNPLINAIEIISLD